MPLKQRPEPAPESPVLGRLSQERLPAIPFRRLPRGPGKGEGTSWAGDGKGTLGPLLRADSPSPAAVCAVNKAPSRSVRCHVFCDFVLFVGDSLFEVQGRRFKSRVTSRSSRRL